MEATAGAFQWLANSFYVLVALAVVYLYFFKIVPIVAGKVSLGSLGGVIQLTLILVVIAILIGFVAVRTADWIFYNVLQSLPGTHIAQEVDRVTGRMLNIPTGPLNYMPGQSQYSNYNNGSTDTADPNYGAVPTPLPYNQDPNYQAPNNQGGYGQGGTPPPDNQYGQGSGSKPVIVLKKNAMSIWAGRMQNVYNPTGRYSDNGQAMVSQDLPMGITCLVYATQPSRLWRTRANEPWTLSCNSGEPQTATDILVNGTAARGLTGGDFYDAGNPMPIYGSGPWPPEAIEQTASPEAPGSRSQGAAPAPASAPAAAVSAAPAVGGPVAASAPSLSVNGTGQRVYVVKSGDSLARIADTYDVNVDQIVTANSSEYPQMVSNNNFIKVGWTLILP